VRVATPDHYLPLYETTNSGAGVATTAADGSFAIGLRKLPKEGKAVVAVTADSGYALRTADELSINPEMVVQAWGRIEGVLRIGKRLGANQRVNLSIWGSEPLYEWNLVSHRLSVRTDASGRFVFPRVAPVDVWLTHDVTVRPGDARPSGHHYVKVGPGDDIHVPLGGRGRVLVGRVDWSSDEKLLFTGSLWADQRHWMRQPRDWRSMSSEERRQHELEWRASPEGELFKEEVRNYEFSVQPDGTFRVEDVLPGSYRLQVRANVPVRAGEAVRETAVAETKVIVPENSFGDAGEPIDVGTLWPGLKFKR
jgi:hypothetical protein